MRAKKGSWCKKGEVGRGGVLRTKRTITLLFSRRVPVTCTGDMQRDGGAGKEGDLKQNRLLTGRGNKEER